MNPINSSQCFDVAYDFIFRIRFIYRFLTVQEAIKLKINLKKTTKIFLRFSLLGCVLYFRNLYCTFLFLLSLSFFNYFLEKIQRQKRFDNRRKTKSFPYINIQFSSLLWVFVFFHVFFGPFSF